MLTYYETIVPHLNEPLYMRTPLTVVSEPLPNSSSSGAVSISSWLV